MIYTLTLNPSLDYIVTVENFELYKTNRTSSENMIAGGKGINVSKMLKNLGIESTAIGFIAGFTGKKIEEDIQKIGINTNFIEIASGFSRINLKLNNYDGTEINGSGPDIKNSDIQKLFAQLKNLQKDDVLIMSGSVPSSCPKTIYSDIMKMLEGSSPTFIVDSNKELLLNVLPYKPFLIKPNLDELSEIFECEINDGDKAIHYAKELRKLGAVNVLISMGKDGAVMVDANNNVFSSQAPSGTLVNSVGAGDSMIAGFIKGCCDTISETKDYSNAFKWALAAGSATAFNEGFATKNQVEHLL